MCVCVCVCVCGRWLVGGSRGGGGGGRVQGQVECFTIECKGKKTVPECMGFFYSLARLVRNKGARPVALWLFFRT